MKENELRLNNLVMVNYKTDLLSKVTWIQERSINVVFDRQPDLVNGVVCSVNDLIPIELTEEWLLKCGFQKKKDWSIHPNIRNYRYMLFLNNFILRYDSRGYGDNSKPCFEFTFPNPIPEIYSVVKVKYIHQLQNLYFALTGEELYNIS